MDQCPADWASRKEFGLTHKPPEVLLEDALAIWRAGVAAVDSRRLVRQSVRREGDTVFFGEHRLRIAPPGKLLVVGAGKAAAGMAEGLLDALNAPGPPPFAVTGWLNVPEDCVRFVPGIHVHGARPPHVNEPTEEGVRGSEAILQLVQRATANDGCVCLLSGGASALLPAPVAEVPLSEKLFLTRYLSAQGANIEQLNTVRKHLSRIKGGRLAAACRAGWLVSLIISDVLGDPLDVIGSGPTVADRSTAAEALAVLEAFHARELAPQAWQYLNRVGTESGLKLAVSCRLVHLVIGNNRTAVEGAGQEALRRGFRVTLRSSTTLEGPAEDVGNQLAATALQMRCTTEPNCLISGGEPVVRLVPAERRGKGGRNQQLVLAALCHLLGRSPVGGSETTGPKRAPMPIDLQQVGRGIVLLSGGTDGEDGPTDAAGAWIDERVCARAIELKLDPVEYLLRNDAYSFFDAVGSLLRTGPTHTNVCDLRVVLVSRP